jgi:hypothetical protein
LALLIKDRRSQQLTTENEVQNRLVNSVDENQTSGKLKEARDKNIPIMTVTEFREKYQV